MPTVQSTYNLQISPAFAGMPEHSDFSATTRNVETVAGIPFGVAVSQGTADSGVLIGAAAAANFVGITIADKTAQATANADAYPRYANASVMTRGEIYVTTGGAVTAGADVTFSSTTGVLSSAATSGTQFAIAGARWMTSAASGALAVVSLGGALPSA